MAQAAQQPIGTDRESLISIVLGAIVVIIIGALAFRYFTNRNNSAEVSSTDSSESGSQNVVEVQELPTEVRLEENENGQKVPANLPASYTVQSGDSTWKIAQAFYGSGFNYVDIEQENGLAAEQGLVVGQKLTIPRVAVRSAEEAGINTNTVTSQEKELPAQQEAGPRKGDNTAAEEMMQQ
jgi:LysM repeat protein